MQYCSWTASHSNENIIFHGIMWSSFEIAILYFPNLNATGANSEVADNEVSGAFN